jgi:hypothetical protein
LDEDPRDIIKSYRFGKRFPRISALAPSDHVIAFKKKVTMLSVIIKNYRPESGS